MLKRLMLVGVVAYPQVSRAFQQAMQDISYYKDNPDVQKVLDAQRRNANSNRPIFKYLLTFKR